MTLIPRLLLTETDRSRSTCSRYKNRSRSYSNNINTHTNTISIFTPVQYQYLHQYNINIYTGTISVSSTVLPQLPCKSNPLLITDYSFQPMPPLCPSISWHLQRLGSLQRTLLPPLPSLPPTHFHTPLDCRGEEEGPDSLSRPSGPTRSSH